MQKRPAKETDIPVEIQKLFTEQRKKRRKRKSVVVSVPETGELLSGIFTRYTDGNKESSYTSKDLRN